MLPFALDRTLTWLDLETTSKNPRDARIVEISIRQFLVDGTEKRWTSRINPGVPIPPDATLKHRITDDDVKDKPFFRDVAARILPAFRYCDFGGYNIRYDIDVLDAEYTRAGIPAERAADDSLPRIIDGLRLWQIVEPRALENFVERWAGRKHVGAHGADADVDGTIDGVVGLLSQVPQSVLPHNIQQLHDLQFPRDPNAVDAKGMFVRDAEGVVRFNFGKHKGASIKAHRSYLQWWADQPGRTSEEKMLLAGWLG